MHLDFNSHLVANDGLVMMAFAINGDLRRNETA